MTLPAAAPPKTPFQKSFFLRTFSDVHWRVRGGRRRASAQPACERCTATHCVGLQQRGNGRPARALRTSTAAKMPPMAANVMPYAPMTRPVASSAGSALPFSTFGTSCAGAACNAGAQHTATARRTAADAALVARRVSGARTPRRPQRAARQPGPRPTSCTRTDQVALTAPMTLPRNAPLPVAVSVRKTQPSGLASMSLMVAAHPPARARAAQP